uniref:CSON011596 protein n=1 Tax=Culicoides sonorensis TaxID=179676 RepID=A0A336N1N8_CULSO
MMMSRKRPRSDDVEAALQLSEDTSNSDSNLNGHSMNQELLNESNFMNGDSSSGVEYSPPVNELRSSGYFIFINEINVYVV